VALYRGHASAPISKLDTPASPPHLPALARIEARWRSGDAEDCKSLHPGSIPGRASIYLSMFTPDCSTLQIEQIGEPSAR
jgi:hypothetical protein